MLREERELGAQLARRIAALFPPRAVHPAGAGRV